MNVAAYVYDNLRVDAKARLVELEAIEDPASQAFIRQLGLLGVERILEAGAGAGSMARWLANIGGSKPRVIATDLAPLFSGVGRVEVVRHDVLNDPLPDSEFDLVHVRHLLFHFGHNGARAVIELLRSALKVGGYLVLEESDLSTWRVSTLSPTQLACSFTSGLRAAMHEYRERGLDPRLGSRLRTMLPQNQWSIKHEARSRRVVRGRSPEAAYQQQTTQVLAREASPLRRPRLLTLAETFENRELVYRTRTTCRYAAIKT